MVHKLTVLPDILETIEFIETAHSGQLDAAGLPLASHSRRVWLKLGEGARATWQHAALLHDVIEDTDYTLDDLTGRGYPAEVVEIVRLVSRVGDEGTYMDFIRGIIASANRGAIAVKLADVLDNNHPARLARLARLDPKKAASLGKRYSKAHEILIEAVWALSPPTE